MPFWSTENSGEICMSSETLISHIFNLPSLAMCHPSGASKHIQHMWRDREVFSLMHKFAEWTCACREKAKFQDTILRMTELSQLVPECDPDGQILAGVLQKLDEWENQAIVISEDNSGNSKNSGDQENSDDKVQFVKSGPRTAGCVMGSSHSTTTLQWPEYIVEHVECARHAI
ncbi:hypothetical protein GYMLUDRAFT_59407 [Collybiopsis luxurians FD-317 M1]|uniref:Uncharacterized protein n=1 Tax=Collybiopsis luxurians FD-317 M1 TaxID=944289 RepID=A0A0D0CDZ0_9AGAR|nr:hypothetical protein GYMLUDRAFT_59407 [Collybiopsis luxurians FD-317 M1]